MNINRHNYEEYFILYMDNELSLEERSQVEAFVKQHPDLREELDTMLQYKLTPDPSLVFPGKEELWKGDSSIHSGNCTDRLLLYIDEELSPEEKGQVETYIKENEFAKQELNLLMRTKILPDTVVFTDKSSLYRREERKIPLFWLRIAAAVVIAALGVTVFFMVNQEKDSIPPTIAKTNPAERPEINNNENSITGNHNGPVDKKEIAGINDINSAPPINEEKTDPAISPLKTNDNITALQKNKLTRDEVVRPLVKKEEAIAINQPKDNNLPRPVNIPVLKVEDKAIASNDPGKELKENKYLNTTDVTTRTDQPSDIRTAAYNPDEPGFADDGKDGKKNKLRGIFRKISRTFEKRTNMDPTDDNKLLVAGFSINLK